MKQSRYVAIRTSFLTLVLMYVSSCMPWVSVLTISHMLSINVSIVFLLDVSSYISYMPLSVSPLMLSLLYHYQGMSFDAIFYMPLSMPISSYAISFISIGHACLPLCYLLCMPIAICMCISFPPITLAFSLLMVSCAPMYWHYVDNRLSRLFFFFFFGLLLWFLWIWLKPTQLTFLVFNISSKRLRYSSEGKFQVIPLSDFASPLFCLIKSLNDPVAKIK